MHIAALIGLGNIAWKYDALAALEAPVLSQAGAILRRDDIRLAGGASPHAPDRQGFAAWHPGLETFTSVQEMLARLRPQLVGICSPTESHFEHARLCLESGIKAIWLEKPPTATAEELDALIALAEEKNAAVAVNYTRRYLPVYRRLREILAAERLGPCRLIRLTYSPGLARNGVHMLDQLFFLTGADDYRVLWVENGPEAATSPCFALKLSTGQLVQGSGADLPYHTNDISAVCREGIVSILRGGKVGAAEVSRENDLFPGFYDLHDDDGTIMGQAGFVGGLDNALADLIYCLENGGQPESSLHSARLTQKLLAELLERAGQ